MATTQAPWLPRGALVIFSCATVACGDGDNTYEVFFGPDSGGQAGTSGDPPAPYGKRITWRPVEVASGEARRRVIASESARVGEQEITIGGYKLLLRSGDAVGPGVFGRLVDQNLEPLVEGDGSERISNYADF